MGERKYKLDSQFGNVDFKNTYIGIDNPEWGRERSMSLEYLNKLLHLQPTEYAINDRLGGTLYVDPSTMKIEVVKDIAYVPYSNQAENSKTPPNISASFTTDEKYLYVWCEGIGRWKRIILSEY